MKRQTSKTAVTGFQIDANVPIPEKQMRYPWKQLKVGHSFFVPGKTPQDIGACRQYATRTLGYKFVSRKLTERGVVGVRVWRIECRALDRILNRSRQEVGTAGM